MFEVKTKQQDRYHWQTINLKLGLTCIMGILTGFVCTAQGAVTYDLYADPVVTDSSLIYQQRQSQVGVTESATVGTPLPVEISTTITATGVINSTTDNNAITASLLGNTSTLEEDLSLVSSGLPAGSSLTSISAHENTAFFATATVNNSSVTSTITDLHAGSSVSLSGNSIAAESDLNKTVQKVEGSLNSSFDSDHTGRVTLQTAAPLLDGDAGLFIGSSQFGLSSSSLTASGNSANNLIALTADTTLESSLTLNADNNRISAAFTGNNAENLLKVETGGAPSLTSSAGIANLQINNMVSSSTTVNNSSISASVQDDPLVSSSLSFDSNQIKASATGSVADNKLQVDGLNVDMNDLNEITQGNSLNFSSGSETASTSGGLFLNNMQIAANSPVSASATNPVAAAALSVDSRGLIDSLLTADGNSFEAIALGNDAYGSISVSDATNFNAAVAASNLQVMSNSVVNATANNGTLAVNLGGSPTMNDDAEYNITGSTISVNDNTISSLAVVNRDPLLINITGTIVTDGISQVAGASVDNAAHTLTSTAGISAISSQVATSGVVVAFNNDSVINLAAGGYPDAALGAGPHVSDSTITQSGNSISSLANINEGLVAVGIAATQLDASTAVASVQNASSSLALAATSGTIETGLNSRAPSLDTDVDNGNLTVLVGEGTLLGKEYLGNSISATAGGNINASALEANAGARMLVTDVIDENGGSSLVVQLSSSAAANNQTLAEMSVLTDQRLDPATITATINASRIAGVISPDTFALSDSTLKVDGNQVSATARGNLTTNSLDFTAQTVDMSGAEMSGSPRGTNLASMGAVQVIGIGSMVEANIDAGGSDEILGRIAGSGDLTNITLSVNDNYVTAQATGTTAISNLTGSGGILAQDAALNPISYLTIDALPTVGTAISNTAAANAVVQSNAGQVMAELATAAQYEITSTIDSTGADRIITGSTLTADNNRAVALATGSSAEVSTVLAFNRLESSAATAVQQAQSGATLALAGGQGGVSIAAYTEGGANEANLVNSRISASGNTAGAQATGATAVTSLTAGGAATNTMASGFSDAAPEYATGAIYGPPNAAAGDTEAYVGDYMLGVQQNVSGVTQAIAEDLSVLASGGRFAGGGLAADNNRLVAQATGGVSTSTLALEASDMTAGDNAANTVIALMSSDQSLAATVIADLTRSDVRTQTVNLTDAANGANSSEVISVNNNRLLAAGSGLWSTNVLTTDATVSVLGDSVGAMGMSATAANVSGGGWDRLIVSKQDITSAGAVIVTAWDNSVSAAVNGDSSGVIGDIEGDTLSVDNNKILAQGIGAGSSNSLTTTAGASITSLSQAIVARQNTAAVVMADNDTPEATLYVDGNSINSTLSLSGNQLAASAAGLTGANTISMHADASITDPGYLTSTSKIRSEQNLTDTAMVGATITDARASLDVYSADGFDIQGSSLTVDNNLQQTFAEGATNSNSLSAVSGALGATGTAGLGLSIYANQTSAAPVMAANNGSITYLTTDETAWQTNLSLSKNNISAVAGNLTGANTLAANSETANIGDYFVLDYETSIRDSADRSILSSQNVLDTGAVNATVASGPTMEIFVNGDLGENSTAFLNENKVASTATVADNRNTLTNAANTHLTSSSLISAIQNSAAAATALTDFGGNGLWIDIDTDAQDSTLTLNDNQATAVATGLTAANTLNVRAGSIEGTPVIYDNGVINAAPSGHEMYGFSAISSEQNNSGDISATVDSPYLAIDVYDDIWNSTVHVDRNLVQASATAASATNTLTQTASTLMIDAPALLAASQLTTGSTFMADATYAVSAEVTASGNGWIGVWTSDDVGDSTTITVDGNTVQAVAKGGTTTNTLDVRAGSIMGTLPASLNGELTAAGSAPSHTMIGASALSSAQNVSGDISARVEYMELGVDVGYDLYDSAAHVEKNLVQASSTAASTTNTLNQHADTTMVNAPALLAASQVIASNSEASVYDTWIGAWISEDVDTSNITVDGNTIQAVATGGVAVNNLNLSANWMQGDNPVGQITSTTTAGYPDHAMYGFSALSSEQSFSGAVSATADYSRLEVAVDDGGIYNSTVHLDNNKIQAFSTAASATNTLMQLADTSMAEAPALLAASQIITGSSSATVSDGAISVYSRYVVDASNISVDSNTIQAVAAGGYMKNFIDPSSGTSMDYYGNYDPSVTTTASDFEGTYGLVSRQTSTTVVTATLDDYQEVILHTDDNITGNSALSVSDNILRSQATNLTADNKVVTAATTALNLVSSGVLSYQDVSAPTSAVTSGSDVSVYSYGIAGTAAVNSNWVLAIATGGKSANDLAVSGLSVSGAAAGAGSSLATSIATGPLALEATSGDDSLVSLLNVQSRTAPVTAELNTLDGPLAVSANFGGGVTGSVSVSNNLMAAQARGLEAENSISLASQTIIDGGSTALGSVQFSNALVSASINSAPGQALTHLRVDDLSGTATLNDNTALADATSNLAVNSLTATAGTQIVSLGSETTTTITSLTDISAGTAGFALQNLQSGSGPATSTITNFNITTLLGPLDGAATVNNNKVLAESRGQVAQNSLVLNAGTDLQSSASLANAQTNGGPISSTILSGNIGLSASDVVGTASISNNRVQAGSTANYAINSMDIGGTLIASGGGNTTPSAPGAITATADYVALNAQSNTAPVSSSVTGFTIGLDHTSSTNGTASVLNNYILASATGNSSVNSFTINAKGSSNTADFAFNGYQSNSGSVSSTISNASISLSSAGGSGTFKNNGNRIGSSSTGNISVSSIRSGI